MVGWLLAITGNAKRTASLERQQTRAPSRLDFNQNRICHTFDPCFCGTAGKFVVGHWRYLMHGDNGSLQMKVKIQAALNLFIGPVTQVQRGLEP
jgi:hypothetical protein